MDGKYHITHKITPHPEGLTREEVRALGDVGACDDIILFSIIHGKDGSLSTQIVSMDGRTGKDLADLELFKAWTMLASHLGESTTLTEGQRKLAATAFEVIRGAIRAAREEPPRPES